MDKIYLQLSKTGDLVSILPMAYADSQKGLKVGIMACAEFASVLDGCSYVEKIVFDGNPWEIPDAFEQAKKLCPNVVVTQTNAPKDVVLKYAYEPAGQKHAATDAHNREQWKLAGMLKDWGKLPLVFDKRDKEREKGWMPKGWFGAGKKKKILLVAADSVSSPFPYRDLLLKILQINYPNFNIIDLTTIKAERFYDLLGLYEAAHCIVTVDTAHLHLAYAVPTLPVMALIQSEPLYWHGSAWRPSHHFHCRYVDFPKRALELFTAIDDIGLETRFFHAYHGGLKKGDTIKHFAIQPGACFRDSANCLQDKEHFPMLRGAIRMFLQVCEDDYAVLTREDTQDVLFNVPYPCYAFRMNRDKKGNDEFFPCVDLFAAPVEFWQKILPEIPDMVMGTDSYWSRVLLELFKMNGAKEIGGIYRNV
jgi:hypothetical protein